MIRTIPLIVVLAVVAAPAGAQNRSVLPAACEELPGNAALSLPLRWSEGTLQVRIDSALLPANLGTQITGLRLRRPTFLGEPAYTALQRTITIRAGFDFRSAAFLTPDRVGNRPANVAVVFGPAPVTAAATAAPGPGTQVGDEFFQVQFTTPLQVTTGHLFLEFETSDAPFQVLPDHWVDAVWFDDGVENGYAVAVGDGSCTTLPGPTELRWNDPAGGPVVGGAAPVRMTGAPVGVFTNVLFGLDPIPRAASPLYVGFGAELTALDPNLAGCHQWTPLDGVIGGFTDPVGGFSASFDLVSGVATTGLQIGVQAIWLDTNRPGMPISVSNGLMLVLDNIGVANRCACAYFPGTATWSPWNPAIGQMPVVVLEHN